MYLGGYIITTEEKKTKKSAVSVKNLAVTKNNPTKE